MSDFRPFQFDQSVNVSNKEPLKELFSLLISLSAIIVILYIALGFLVDIVADTLSVETETSLLGFMTPIPDDAFQGKNKDLNALQARVDRVFNLLPSSFKDSLPAYNYKLSVVHNDDINAVSLPGGRILIFSGLLEKIPDDKDLVFVIGHELGHFVHRDHLRGLGRGLIFALASSMISGSDGGLSSLFTGLQTTLLAQHSQKQEFAADDWGLKAYQSVYHSAKGASDFMKNLQALSKNEKSNRWTQMLDSHPLSSARISRLEAMSASH